MPLENLNVARICLHEVHVRRNDGNVTPPTYGQGLLRLPPQALEAFRARVIAAFRTNSQSMTMSIRQHGDGSALANGEGLRPANDHTFVERSRRFADALAAVQTSRAIPGGLVVVFDGTVGHPARYFFGIMKAELHEGFIKTVDLQAQFVNDLFLSPKTKLYKIGLFVALEDGANRITPDQWRAIVYDSAMSSSNRDAAATYFYSAFLGLDIPADAAQQVRVFFEKTREFVATANLSQQEKVDLFNCLYTYLKLDQGNTVQVSHFAERYMAPDLADEYISRMRQLAVPDGAISKDLSEVAGSLRLRKLRFPRSITLAGPPDAVSELVSVTAVPGEHGQEWTQVLIRARLQSQE